MPIIKRGDIYWTDIRHDGRRIRKSTRTSDKKSAEELHDKIKSELWRVDKLEEKQRRSWKEAVLRFLDETKNNRTHEKQKMQLRYLDKFIGNKMLDEITRDDIDHIRQQSNKERSQATTNRYLAVIRTILVRSSKEWGWVDNVPYVKMTREKANNLRWLTKTEAACLINECPPHLKDMVIFALSTGLRESNVCRLKWVNVDIARNIAYVQADESKNGRVLTVPLNEDAKYVIINNIGKHGEYVFTFQGEPVKRINSTAWRKAIRRAGLDIRFHDLRHTWASWHVQNGTPLHVLKELGGWVNLSMVQRYAHLSVEHLQGYSNGITGLVDTKKTQAQIRIIK